MRRCGEPPRRGDADAPELGSIIVVVATDAPLLPHQLQRLVKRVAIGLGRQGGFGSNGSGDIFVAFSTANPGTAFAGDSATVPVRMLPNSRISPLLKATAQATEAAITNALLAAETMTGRDGWRVFALPLDRTLAILRRHGRLP
jgi:L-aminopeptidase/D-esterase-like protein